MKLCAVVVTFNRRVLLQRCLLAIASQTRKPDHTLIVDNASTDGTLGLLEAEGWLQRDNVELLPLPENTGGAGGFSSGLQNAIRNGADWVWMMDDDAEPHPAALEELLQVAGDPANVYGSLATNGPDTAWLTTVLKPPIGEVERADDIPARCEVQSLPFLGFLIHRDLVDKIGLPDAGYFIAADDVEYCLRAQRAGAEVIIAGKSRIEHPKSRPYKARVFGRTLTCLALPPWKRYYDTRNRLLIAREYYGPKLFTQTIPGSFVRFFSALAAEPRKLAQTHAFCTGLVDGLLGLKGMRHLKWGIKP